MAKFLTMTPHYAQHERSISVEEFMRTLDPIHLRYFIDEVFNKMKRVMLAFSYPMRVSRPHNVDYYICLVDVIGDQKTKIMSVYNYFMGLNEWSGPIVDRQAWKNKGHDGIISEFCNGVHILMEIASNSSINELTFHDLRKYYDVDLSRFIISRVSMLKKVLQDYNALKRRIGDPITNEMQPSLLLAPLESYICNKTWRNEFIIINRLSERNDVLQAMVESKKYGDKQLIEFKNQILCALKAMSSRFDQYNKIYRDSGCIISFMKRLHNVLVAKLVLDDSNCSGSPNENSLTDGLDLTTPTVEETRYKLALLLD